MGYILTRDGFDAVLKKLGERYRRYAPTVKVGEGRFTDVDVVRYGEEQANSPKKRTE